MVSGFVQVRAEVDEPGFIRKLPMNSPKKQLVE